MYYKIIFGNNYSFFKVTVYVNGYLKRVDKKIHRKNFKPAVGYSSGEFEFWVDNLLYFPKEDYIFREVTYIRKLFEERLYQDGTICYCNPKGILSNVLENTPSITYPNGTKEWYRDGILHREDGPAVEYSNGDQEWWWLGQKHRFGGPAVILKNKEYYYEFGILIRNSTSDILWNKFKSLLTK